MAGIVLRIVINALAIVITAAILPGITVVNDDIGTLILLGIVFGLVNG
ncbi:MAG: phage holin family protein, partial [Anaerolineae bacterium]|nr:phage holin family protein [Anaerolineae bacterium]